MNERSDQDATQDGEGRGRGRWDVVARRPLLVGFLVPFVGGLVLALALGFSGYDVEADPETPGWLNIAGLPVIAAPLWLPAIGAALVPERRGYVAVRLFGGALVGWFMAAAGLASVTGAS